MTFAILEISFVIVSIFPFEDSLKFKFIVWKISFVRIARSVHNLSISPFFKLENFTFIIIPIAVVNWTFFQFTFNKFTYILVPIDNFSAFSMKFVILEVPTVFVTIGKNILTMPFHKLSLKISLIPISVRKYFFVKIF